MTPYAVHPLDLVDDVAEPIDGWPSLCEMVADFWDAFDDPYPEVDQ